MNEKNKLIQRMLELQHLFIAYEQKDGLEPKDYFVPPNDHLLADYRKEYDELATRVIDLAHEEKNSKR